MTKAQREILENYLDLVYPLLHAMRAALDRIDELEAGPKPHKPIQTAPVCPACGSELKPPKPIRIALVCPACGSGNNFLPNPHTRPGTRQCNKCGHQWEEFEVRP